MTTAGPAPGETRPAGPAGRDEQLTEVKTVRRRWSDDPSRESGDGHPVGDVAADNEVPGDGGVRARVTPRVVVDFAASHVFGPITTALDTERVHQWLSTSGRQ